MPNGSFREISAGHESLGRFSAGGRAAADAGRRRRRLGEGVGLMVIDMIEEVYGKPIRAGQSFSAAHIVGYFDTIDQMHELYEQYRGNTALAADATGWRLEK